MKKILLPLAICMILFSSCNRSLEQPQSIPISQRSFQSSVTIQCSDFTASGLLAHEQTGAFRLDLLSPTVLDGLSIRLSEEELSLTYNGLSASYSAEDQLLSGPVKLLFDSVSRMDTAKAEEYSAALSDGTVCTAYFDPESDEILRIGIPEHELEIVFSDFIYTDIS